ncbi:MAG: hypothetical protein JSW60_09490, partial [Thermoplasmatales archaeon]
MSVKKTESHIPTGFSPEDLGEVGNFQRGDGQDFPPDCFLIAYFTSPVTIGVENKYVVFINEPLLNENIKAIKWEFYTKDSDGNKIILKTVDESCEGDEVIDTVETFHFEKKIHLYIDVTLTGESPGHTRILSLEQTTKKSNQYLENFINSKGFFFATAGDKEATKLIRNNLIEYVRYALESSDSDNTIPYNFLLCVIYYSIVFKGIDLFNYLTERSIRIRLNRSSKEDFARYSIGLTNVEPRVYAMILEDYYDWEEFDEDDINILKWSDLTDKFCEVDIYKLIDLYNLLRFPKSHILLCYKFLNKLKNRDKRYPSLSTYEFSVDHEAMDVIAGEFIFGIGKSNATNELVEKSNRYIVKMGHEILNVLNSPFIQFLYQTLTTEARTVVCVADEDTGKIKEIRDPLKGIYEAEEKEYGEHFGINPDTLIDTHKANIFDTSKQMILLDVGYWGHYDREIPQRDFGIIEGRDVYLCRLHYENRTYNEDLLRKQDNALTLLQDKEKSLNIVNALGEIGYT